jgi:hypothetical protein
VYQTLTQHDALFRRRCEMKDVLLESHTSDSRRSQYGAEAEVTPYFHLSGGAVRALGGSVWTLEGSVKTLEGCRRRLTSARCGEASRKRGRDKVQRSQLGGSTLLTRT